MGVFLFLLSESRLVQVEWGEVEVTADAGVFRTLGEYYGQVAVDVLIQGARYGVSNKPWKGTYEDLRSYAQKALVQQCLG